MDVEVDIVTSYDSECKTTTKEYTYIFDTKPVYTTIITGIREKEILTLKLWGSEKYPEVREKYMGKLKGVLIRALKKHGLSIVFYHLKRSCRVSFIFPQLMSFITSELKRTEKLKAPIFLKAAYYLFLNDEISFEKNVSSNIVCSTSLKKFLVNLLKSRVLRYLLKDLAADIMCEMRKNSKVVSDNAIVLLSHELKEIHEDSYGGTVKFLTSVTPVTDAKSLLIELNNLSKKVFSSPRMCSRLLSKCESLVYSSSPSQREILFNLYNLLRYESIFAALLFDVEYEEKYSKTFHFSDLLFDHVKMMTLANADEEIHHKTDERETDRPMEIQILTPVQFFEPDRTSSFMENGNFWDFSFIETVIDRQLVFFGYFSPLENGVFDVYFCEKENVCSVSTSPSDSDPINLELSGQDVYDPFRFKISDGNILFQRRRSSKKRKFSAIS